MGKGGSSTSTTKPPSWVKPYVVGGINEAQSIYGQNKAPTQDIASSIQGLLPDLISKYQAGNPGVDAASGYATDVLSGRYLAGSNPYLDGIVNQTADNVTDRTLASLGTRGRVGGDAHSSLVSKNLADSELALRYSDYNAERDRMGQAAGLIPGLTAADYAGILPALSVAEAGVTLPYAGINNLTQNIDGLLSPYKTTSTSTRQSTGSNIAQGLGTALTAVSLFSDRRLKENVELVGAFPDGLGVYSYNYIWDDNPRLGVMADEVAEIRPWALGPKINGFATVNYGAL